MCDALPVVINFNPCINLSEEELKKPFPFASSLLKPPKTITQLYWPVFFKGTGLISQEFAKWSNKKGFVNTNNSTAVAIKNRRFIFGFLATMAVMRVAMAQVNGKIKISRTFEKKKNIMVCLCKNTFFGR
jgi:hypothetical protein